MSLEIFLSLITVLIRAYCIHCLSRDTFLRNMISLVTTRWSQLCCTTSFLPACSVYDYQSYSWLYGAWGHNGGLVISTSVSWLGYLNQRTLNLSFNSHTPPTYLTLCPVHTVSVREFYQLPTWCFKYQHHSHSHLAWKSEQAVCGRCSIPSSDDHNMRTCSREAHSFHWKDPHAASSPHCLIYITDRRISYL